MQADTGAEGLFLFPVFGDVACLRSFLPWLYVRDLYHLSCVNRHLHQALVESKEGIDFWIKVAARVVSYPDSLFQHQKVVEDLKKYLLVPPRENKGYLKNHMHSEFFTQLRTLVCPWMSSYECVQTGGMLRLVPSPERMILSRDGNRIIFQSDQSESLQSMQASCPSQKDANFYETIRSSEPRNKELEMEDNQLQRAMELMPNLLNLHPGFPSMYSKEFRYFVVHGGVVAIAEFFGGICGSPIEDERGGIYFFSCHDGRMLRHFNVFGFMANPDKFFLQFAPKKMWIYNRSHLHMYGYNEQSKIARTGTPPELLDGALWLAGKGDVQGAIALMEQIWEPFWSQLPKNPERILNSYSDFSHKTMLHYAAMEGQDKVCEELLRKKAGLDIPDMNGETALHLAIRAGHHKVVVLLLSKYESIERDNIRLCVRALDFPILNNRTGDEAFILTECRETLPFLFRQLVFKADFTRNGRNIPFLDALKHPRVLASSDAVRIIFQDGGDSLRELYRERGWIKEIFMLHDYKVQEIETTHTLRFLFEELGFPLNEAAFSLFWAEPPLIYAVKHGGLVTVKFLVEEMKADIQVVSVKGKKTIFELAWNRVNSSGNERDVYEGRKIRHYLVSLLESVPGRVAAPPPEIVPKWEV